MQQNGTAPSTSLSQYSLAALVRKSPQYLVSATPFSISAMGVFRQVQSNPVSAIMSIGPSLATAGQLGSSHTSAGSQISAMDMAKTTTQQYIQYTTQILQSTIQIEQGLEKIQNDLADNKKNAIPQLAQMESQTQDQIKMLQDKIQALNGVVGQLNQSIYGQLQNYDQPFTNAIQEAQQRAPLIAHAASINAQMNGGATSTTYYDALHGQRFILIPNPDHRGGMVLALR
jgi:hypothetical protein